GEMLKNLQAAGIKPEEIKAVLISHSHGDHVGGLLKEEKAVFPNAKIWLSDKELDYWKTSNREQYEKCVKAYGEPKIAETDEKTPVFWPEIVAIDIAGHTPGHTAYLVTAKEKEGNKSVKLLFAGDLLHGAALQFAYPEFCASYDQAPEKSVAVRRALLKRAAEDDWIFTSVHLPRPCIVKLKTDGDGFRDIK
ncbi:MAG: MBL fold metallo-hydrolase, partial [Thermoguttaceae bacterium]